MNTDVSCWLKSRQSGALLHLSSLPSRFGIGSMGNEAKSFIDYLSVSGFSYWQVCPIGPTGYGDSPYQSFSSFGGNPYFIDLESLIADGLLLEEETVSLKNLPQDKVDYGALYACFWPALDAAFDRFDANEGQSEDFQNFLETNAYWINAYATFMALKKRFHFRPWNEWPAAFRNGPTLKPADLSERDTFEIRKQQFYQYIFFRQWSTLRSYANAKGIEIIGDVPIYVALDSADCWQAPELFEIDSQGNPTAVAGVPPDYFSDTGQLWGNPLYNWQRMDQDRYQWWIARLEASFALYDVIRLDHFRGFDSYWEIPAGAPDASQGRWRKGPGTALFDSLMQALPQARFIAEDLGYINRDVFELRRQTGFPGMKIIQFGFGHDDNNVNLPHFYENNHVVYTGTHDNDTLRGWFAHLDPVTRRLITDYFECQESNATQTLIKAAFASVARLCVIPVQDILDLSNASRMNTPGTAEGNWQWRLSAAQFQDLLANHSEPYRLLNQKFNRIDDHSQRDFSAPPLLPVSQTSSKKTLAHIAN